MPAHSNFSSLSGPEHSCWRAMAARIYVMYTCKPLHAHSQFTAILHQPRQKLPHRPSPHPGTKRPGWQQRHNVLSHGAPGRPATGSQHVNGSSPELLQWKANLESWDTQPSSQERLPNGGLPVLFFKNRLDKKATKLAEPEINKPAFGQGQAFKTGYILCFLSSA